ncbi:hypothetical protein QBC46DRAFT_365695 [Diplogelasinospora grovesii]|uniref:Uncharacterized protein n=1 Tax=Diplogelasinospora grovesii TaxID=303347 RepID=A0AAN6N3X6_9PEZI|nr:hypothetical protein QBC46DRAFT_365695 [Diplogelasinospora grovesii]
MKEDSNGANTLRDGGMARNLLQARKRWLVEIDAHETDEQLRAHASVLDIPSASAPVDAKWGVEVELEVFHELEDLEENLVGQVQDVQVSQIRT